MTSIFIQIVTIKSAEIWEEQGVVSAASFIVTWSILLETGVGKLQPVGQIQPTTCYLNTPQAKNGFYNFK